MSSQPVAASPPVPHSAAAAVLAAFALAKKALVCLRDDPEDATAAAVMMPIAVAVLAAMLRVRALFAAAWLAICRDHVRVVASKLGFRFEFGLKGT
jgi:hypothetical protein